MTIENRDLAPGTRLVGTHRKATYLCEVVHSPEGEMRFRLEDGRLFNSPSATGKAVMNGISCNGWRFWNLAGTSPKQEDRSPAGGESAAPPPTTGKRVRQIKRVPNQHGVEEGETRWFCSACMKGFLMPTGDEPASCPEGHPWEVQDDFAIA